VFIIQRWRTWNSDLKTILTWRLRIEIFNSDSEDSTFKIECMYCKEELEHYSDEESYNKLVLMTALESDLLI